MLRTVLFIALLFPDCAFAQSADTDNMAQHHAMMSGTRLP